MAVVVITGASSGIGEATARELAKHGHQLVLAARRTDRLEALAAELAPMTAVLVVQTDVAVPSEIERLAAAAGERFGRIDVWINNAGVGSGQPWWERSPAELRRVLDVNLTAPLLGVRAALPWMKGNGHVINIGSVAGSIGTTAPYSATKFGMRGMSDSMRRELASLGVRVSLVTPGFLKTEMTEYMKGFPMPSADVAARAIARLIRRPRREVVVPGYWRLVIFLARLFPGLSDWIAIRLVLPRMRR